MDRRRSRRNGGIKESLERVCNHSVSLAGCVLVEQCRARGRMTHSGHQLPRTGSGCRRQGVAGVAEIVKSQVF